MKPVKFMNKYQITADNLNSILQEKKRNKIKNKDYWDGIAFFVHPKDALKYVIKKHIRESWVEDLKQVVKGMEKLEKAIDKLGSLSQIRSR